jgi:hypothetical protein
MSEKVSWRDDFKRLFSWRALPGWLVGLWKPIGWVLGKVSDFDTLRSHGDLMKVGFLAALSFITSPWGYLVSIIAGFAWLTFVIVRTEPDKTHGNTIEAEPPAITQHPADFTPSGGVLYTPTITQGPPPQIFVADISAVFGAYNREGFIRFKIVVVACSTKLALSRFVAGRVSCRLDSSNNTHAALTSQIFATTALFLSEPSIESVNPAGRLTAIKADATTFPIHRGISVIVLKQHLSPTESANISVALAPNRGLEFDFTDLTLSVTSPEFGTERLALWDGVVCAVGAVSSYRIKINKTAPGPSEIVLDIATEERK